MLCSMFCAKNAFCVKFNFVKPLFLMLVLPAGQPAPIVQPTNHLDLEAIDSLADAIRRFKGGLVLVSHDFRLIDQVANEIWVCENGTVTRWDGDIRSYKHALAAKMGLV